MWNITCTWEFLSMLTSVSCARAAMGFTVWILQVLSWGIESYNECQTLTLILPLTWLDIGQMILPSLLSNKRRWLVWHPAWNGSTEPTAKISLQTSWQLKPVCAKLVSGPGIPLVSDTPQPLPRRLWKMKGKKVCLLKYLELGWEIGFHCLLK